MTNSSIFKNTIKILNSILLLVLVLGAFLLTNQLDLNFSLVEANEEINKQPKTKTIYEERQASESDSLIIGCLNQDSLETRKPTANNDCMYGRGRENILLPPKRHIPIWYKVFEGNERAMINRMPVVNHESGFNPNAGNNPSNYNPWAKGYVQTLRKYHISLDIEEQLSWMKDRMDHQKQRYIAGVNGRIDACGKYLETDNIRDGFQAGEDGVMACLYRWHYHANDGTWYAKKLMKTREYYYNFFNENSIRTIRKYR